MNETSIEEEKKEKADAETRDEKAVLFEFHANVGFPGRDARAYCRVLFSRNRRKGLILQAF